MPFSVFSGLRESTSVLDALRQNRPTAGPPGRGWGGPRPQPHQHERQGDARPVS